MSSPGQFSNGTEDDETHLRRRVSRSLAMLGTLRLGPKLARMHWQLGIPPDYDARGLPRHREATDLVPITDALLATPDTVLQFRAMQGVAARHGITLVVNDAYRGYDRQAKLIHEWSAQGVSIKDILTRMTAPGHSEHHSGRAIDLGCPGYLPAMSDFAPTPTFAESPAYLWLCEYAPRFGFVQTYSRVNAYGMMFKPWHWCYHPTEPHYA